MRYFLYATLCWALTGMGCLTQKDHLVSKNTPVQEITPAPVTEKDVNRANAHQMADALWEEMDRQVQNNMVGQTGIPPAGRQKQ